MTAPGSTMLEDRYGTKPRRASKRSYWVIGAIASLSTVVPFAVPAQGGIGGPWLRGGSVLYE